MITVSDQLVDYLLPKDASCVESEQLSTGVGIRVSRRHLLNMPQRFRLSDLVVRQDDRKGCLNELAVHETMTISMASMAWIKIQRIRSFAGIFIRGAAHVDRLKEVVCLGSHLEAFLMPQLRSFEAFWSTLGKTAGRSRSLAPRSSQPLFHTVRGWVESHKAAIVQLVWPWISAMHWTRIGSLLSVGATQHPACNLDPIESIHM